MVLTTKIFGKIKSAIAALTALGFFFSTTGATVVEASLWEQRRAAIRTKTYPNRWPTPSDLALERIPTPSQAMRWRDPFPSDLLTDHADVIRLLSNTHGSVRKISLPTRTTARRLVIHIQDVHQNLEAQRNISATVAALADKVDLVALEGSTRTIDLARFRNFSERGAVALAADEALAQNEITGPVHAALTGAESFPAVLGVENAGLYAANIEAFRRSSPLADTEKKRLAGRSIDLGLQKESVFSRPLLAFDRTVTSYHDGRQSLPDYVAAVTQNTPNLPLDVHRFSQALNLEKTLNFRAVETERALAVELLAARLDAKALEDLRDMGLSYRLGKIRFGEFYGYLQTLCLRRGVALGKNLSDYIRYALLADGVDAEKLFQELSVLERVAYSRFARTPAEKELIARSRRLRLEQKLVTFALTPEEWSEYENGNTHSNLPTFEEFYRVARSRDESMASNLMRAISNSPSHRSVAVLVTGGYHAPGLADHLTKAGAAVVSFVPKIEKIDTAEGEVALGIFAREKTPLQKLFEGQILFLGQDPAPEEVTALTLPAKVAATAKESRHAFAALASSTILGRLQNVFRNKGALILRFMNGTYQVHVDENAPVGQRLVGNVVPAAAAVVAITGLGAFWPPLATAGAVGILLPAALAFGALILSLPKHWIRFLSLLSAVPGAALGMDIVGISGGDNSVINSAWYNVLPLLIFITLMTKALQWRNFIDQKIKAPIKRYFPEHIIRDRMETKFRGKFWRSYLFILIGLALYLFVSVAMATPLSILDSLSPMSPPELGPIGAFEIPFLTGGPWSSPALLLGAALSIRSSEIEPRFTVKETETDSGVYVLSDKKTGSTVRVDLSHGNQVTSFVVDGEEVLDQNDAFGGIRVHWPFANRVKGDFIGRSLDQVHAIEKLDDGTPIHGFAKNVPWKVEKSNVDRDGAFVRASLNISDFPDLERIFGQMVLTVEYRLKENGLTIKSWVKNNDEGERSMSLGFHPAFRVPQEREKVKVMIPAKQHWVTNDKSFPTGELESVQGTKHDFQIAVPIAENKFDDVYTELGTKGGFSTSTIYDPTFGRTITVQQSSIFRHTVLCVAGWADQAVFLEPQTSAADAFRLAGEGNHKATPVVLSSGQSVDGEVQILITRGRSQDFPKDIHELWKIFDLPNIRSVTEFHPKLLYHHSVFYIVVVDDGNRYFVKGRKNFEDLDKIEMEEEYARLAEHARLDGTPTPKKHLSRNSKFLERVGNTFYSVDEYHERIQGHWGPTTSQRDQAANLLAAIHKSLQNEEPTKRPNLIQELQKAAEILQKVEIDSLPEGEVKEFFVTMVADWLAYYSHLTKLLPLDRYRPLAKWNIHGDFAPVNLLLDESGRYVSVIDFSSSKDTRIRDFMHGFESPLTSDGSIEEALGYIAARYQKKASQLGIPLSEEEVKVIPLVYLASRLRLLSWMMKPEALLLLNEDVRQGRREKFEWYVSVLKKLKREIGAPNEIQTWEEFYKNFLLDVRNGRGAEVPFSVPKPFNVALRLTAGVGWVTIAILWSWFGVPTEGLFGKWSETIMLFGIAYTILNLFLNFKDVFVTGTARWMAGRIYGDVFGPTEGAEKPEMDEDAIFKAKRRLGLAEKPIDFQLKDQKSMNALGQGNRWGGYYGLTAYDKRGVPEKTFLSDWLFFKVPEVNSGGSFSAGARAPPWMVGLFPHVQRWARNAVVARERERRRPNRALHSSLVLELLRPFRFLQQTNYLNTSTGSRWGVVDRAVPGAEPLGLGGAGDSLNRRVPLGENSQITNVTGPVDVLSRLSSLSRVDGLETRAALLEVVSSGDIDSVRSTVNRLILINANREDGEVIHIVLAADTKDAVEELAPLALGTSFVHVVSRPVVQDGRLVPSLLVAGLQESAAVPKNAAWVVGLSKGIRVSADDLKGLNSHDPLEKSIREGLAAYLEKLLQNVPLTPVDMDTLVDVVATVLRNA